MHYELCILNNCHLHLTNSDASPSVFVFIVNNIKNTNFDTRSDE